MLSTVILLIKFNQVIPSNSNGVLSYWDLRLISYLVSADFIDCLSACVVRALLYTLSLSIYDNTVSALFNCAVTILPCILSECHSDDGKTTSCMSSELYIVFNSLPGSLFGYIVFVMVVLSHIFIKCMPLSTYCELCTLLDNAVWSRVI